jgi:hypothetical protein
VQPIAPTTRYNDRSLELVLREIDFVILDIFGLLPNEDIFGRQQTKNFCAFFATIPVQQDRADVF